MNVFLGMAVEIYCGHRKRVCLRVPGVDVCSLGVYTTIKCTRTSKKRDEWVSVRDGSVSVYASAVFWGLFPLLAV
jgi:hypothetical protein